MGRLATFSCSTGNAVDSVNGKNTLGCWVVSLVMRDSSGPSGMPPRRGLRMGVVSIDVVSGSALLLIVLLLFSLERGRLMGFLMSTGLIDRLVSWFDLESPVLALSSTALILGLTPLLLRECGIISDVARLLPFT